MPSIQEVYGALKAVKLPQIDKDVVSAGAVRKLVVSGGAVSFDLAVSLPEAAPEGWLDARKNEAEAAVKALDGVSSVHIDASVSVRAAPEKRAVMPDVKHVIAVASGKGGVGKSTTAANLALALARAGARVGLLDADIYGPSMPTMFGASGRPEPVSDKLVKPLDAHGIKLMSIGFLVDPDTPMVWRGPMVHGALNQFLEQVVWGELDYVIVDMPPGTGDAQLTLTQKAPLSGAVIVTTPQQVSLVDARKGLKMFEQVKVPVLGIIENMSVFICDGCDKEHEIFLRGGGARTAKELGVPFLGEVPLQAGLAASGDEGEPIVVRAPDSPAGKAFASLAKSVMQALPAASNGPTGSDLNLSWQS
ncbi:MAG: iron-sulfur cluster carrier protein [Planctomycetota bacterium]|nr:MAG: iron-sulfur cluster carrier protein [Planctomycetota bacterium]